MWHRTTWKVGEVVSLAGEAGGGRGRLSPFLPGLSQDPSMPRDPDTLLLPS